MIAALAAGRSFAQVIINEIMYAPLAPEPEWVELYNADTTAVDLTGWALHDAGTSKATLPPSIIPARGYIVITKDTATLRSLRLIGGPLVKGTLPGLNNSGDIVMLRESTGRTIDSLRYTTSWGGTGGFSLERRGALRSSTAASSWGSSTSPTGATPGALNSLSPAALDLRLIFTRLDDATNAITAHIVNAGTNSASAAEVVLYHDDNNDGKGDIGEALARQSIAPPVPGDSSLLFFTWPYPLTDDEVPGVLELLLPGDERPENNIASFIARRTPLDSGLVINEIMVDPLMINGSTGAEYVELFNPTERSISVAKWQILDGTGDPQATIEDDAPPIPPGGYLVIATDSSLYLRFPSLRDSINVLLIGTTSLSLNNDGDDVALHNASGRSVDSVRYDAGWHRHDIGEVRGIALERISAYGSSNDARNWSSSVAAAGGTPGRDNSVAIPVTSSETTLDVQPRTVSPDGDGYEDFTRIAFHLPSRSARITVTAYDRQGRAVRRIANNEATPPVGELIFDGLDDDGCPLPVGIYIVRLESYDDTGGGLTSTQATVVVARKL